MTDVALLLWKQMLPTASVVIQVDCRYRCCSIVKETDVTDCIRCTAGKLS